MAGVLLEARPYRPFKSSEEYLYAMKEDLAEWLNILYSDLQINVDNFMDKLETGVVLCKHANSVKKTAEEYVARKHLRKMTSSQALTASLMTRTALPITKMGEIIYRLSAKPGTFFARDNVSNFIDFCRHGLEIIECLLFETDDLIMRKNEKNVILCLLEVARRGAKFGMLAPILVQMEREIDREIAAEQRLARGDTEDESSEDEEECIPYGPIPQIVTNDLKNLDEMVRDLVEKCTCPTQFPMIRVSEGKYRIGDTKVLIFVRILRSHVMVRVGGGWDTLSHYLDKHDPCRCRTGHKAALSSKLIMKNTGPIELNNAQVLYERSPPRTRRSSASSSSSGHGGRDLLPGYPTAGNRSRSPTPKGDGTKRGGLHPQKYVTTYLLDGTRQGSVSPKRGRSISPGNVNRPSYNTPTLASRNRSRSPSVRGLVEHQKKKNASDTQVLAKQHDVKYLTATQLPEAEVEPARRAKVTLEAKEPGSTEDGKQNDSGSEVSDEGYRSLGLVITSPLTGEGKVVTNDVDRIKNGHSVADGSDTRESPTSECSLLSNGFGTHHDHSYVNQDDAKGKPVRKLSKQYLHPRPLQGSKSAMKFQPTSRKTSRVSSRSSSPIGNGESQVPVRRYSVVNEPDLYRRKSNKENEIRKTPRSRSATPGRYNSVEVPAPPHNSKSASENKFGTWNGKGKKRSGLQSEGHGTPGSNFTRNGVGRSSLGAHSGYESGLSRRTSQKNMSPLLADLLKTKNLNDDKTILLKMREIINQYSGIFDESSPGGRKFEGGSTTGPAAADEDDETTADSDNLDFTSQWVRNNGSLVKMEGGDTVVNGADEKASPNKRKDSKYDGAHSKIPAPVFFKQHLSEKEC